MYIGKGTYKGRLAEYAIEGMHENGFIHPKATGAEISALRDVFPDGYIRYSITGMPASGIYAGGYYFKSPQPQLSVQEILTLAQGLRKQTKETLRNAIRRVIALTDEDVQAFVVLVKLSGEE
jgi:hypothetical protein